MPEYIYKEFNKLLKKALRYNEVPVACIITYNDKIIAKTYNQRNKSKKTIDHSEIIAIIKANKKLKNWRLNKCTLYCTIEPCEMCKTVIKESRIDKVYYLLSRPENKKQYNNTKFNQVENPNEKFLEKYKKNIEIFWKNKR